MKICLLEPFYTGSHAAWANEYVERSAHEIELLTLSGRHWKWRMHGGAVSLAHMFLEKAPKPDLLLATDMLDLTTFLALTRQKTHDLKTAVYFHENQLTYPWSPTDPDTKQARDAHYAFINYATALAADALLFNSHFHRHSFLDQLPAFLKEFPDCNGLENLDTIRQKSTTLPLGLDLRQLDAYRPEGKAEPTNAPIILWNHRWEYDKNPDEFFRALFMMQEEGYQFNLVILGESFRNRPAIFDEARARLRNEILHIGYAESFADYARWLWQADILPVTSRHDFFGASVVQAIYCQCTPLLPRRLAYPEHLPKALWGDYLYNDFEDLLTKLRSCLKTSDVKRIPLARHVSAYDWAQMAEKYDQLLESLV